MSLVDSPMNEIEFKDWVDLLMRNEETLTRFHAGCDIPVWGATEQEVDLANQVLHRSGSTLTLYRRRPPWHPEAEGIWL